ncbi:MAG: sugar phosphate isomerase/epimerase family protein, partial [Anaerolineae bacterium]
ATLNDYKSIIRHVHLKDWGGGRFTGYADYEPIGSGVVDMAGVFRVLEDANFGGWVMVELDGTPQAPRPPREAAAMSKRYLENLLGDKAVWAK